jgi:hypothetical protein
MIEVLETIEVEGEECPVMATLTNGPISTLRRLLWPYSMDRPDGSHCGHAECFCTLTVHFEMSLN